jgi:cytochrome b subunit of formate dehydrogenase
MGIRQVDRKRRGAVRIAALAGLAFLTAALCQPAQAQAPAPTAPAAETPGPAAAPAADAAPAATPLKNETCLGCHGVESLLAPTRAAPGGPPPVLTDRFHGSAHGKLQCVECHKNITQIPHQKVTVQVGCVDCHEELYENAKDGGSPDRLIKLEKVIGEINRYMGSIHARPSKTDQSRTNATCYACHDAHYVYPPGTPNYNWWRLNLPYTCGKCHEAELAAYKTSVHGKEVLENGNANAAVCSDCHTGMNIQDPFKDSTQISIVRNCGNCHKEEYASYLDTYHGQVNKLGFTYTAKCFNCHGSHDIKRVSDPQSRVSPENRLATCKNCHLNATPGFLSFQPHANPHDFARYPYSWLASKFMLLLLGGVFAFFWTHSALWYFREFRDHQLNKDRPHVNIWELPKGEPVVFYRRWPLTWRIAHLSFALATIALVFTGMTLFDANSVWAPIVSHWFGGPRITGIVHRTAAVVFVGVFFWHLGYLALRIGPKWRTFRWFGPNSLIPNLQDVRDIIAMFKWFFGLAKKPNFDRWSYWEKFDYWAPFWGVAIIGTSGAIMWFKEFTATYLPGWVFNLAMIFHGEEAVLAAGFLFTVHFFNNHWRPDKFPLDILMFTGRMPLEEYKREHAVEYRRLVESGQLDKYLTDAPSQPMTLGSKILGFTLMACGLILLYFTMTGFLGRVTAG